MLVRESCDGPLFDHDKQIMLEMKPRSNELLNYTLSQELDQIITLPESRKPFQLKWVNECRQIRDNEFGVNYTQEEKNNCPFNREKQSVANSTG